MARIRYYMLSVVTLIFLFVAPVQASLLGSSVMVNFLFPDTSTIFVCDPMDPIFPCSDHPVQGTSQIVGPGGVEFINFDSFQSQVNPTDIIITNHVAEARNLDFLSSADDPSITFNGPQFLFSGVSIAGVIINPASRDGLGASIDSSRLLFSSGEIQIDLQGLRFNPDFFLQLDVATVPEPSSVILLASGLLGLLGYNWRRRRHAA